MNRLVLPETIVVETTSASTEPLSRSESLIGANDEEHARFVANELQGSRESRSQTLVFEAAVAATLSAMAKHGPNEVAAYMRHREEQLRSFVSALLSSALYRGNSVFEWRLSVLPVGGRVAEGKVSVRFLARIDGRTTDEVLSLQEALAQLLQSHFPEYDFVPREQITADFEIEDLRMIARPIRLESLESDTTKSVYPQVQGFGTRYQGSCARQTDVVFALGSFVLDGRITSALTTLLHGRQSFSISVRLEPTFLQQTEWSVLEGQFELAERHSQLALDDPKSDLSYRRKADILSRTLSARLSELQSSAARLTILLASDRSIPPIVSSLLGGTLAADPERATSDVEQLLGISGFDIIELDPAKFGACIAELASAPSVAELCRADIKIGRLREIVGVREAAAVFGPPAATTDPLVGLTKRNWQRPLPPRDLSECGVLLGVSLEGPSGRAVRIRDEDRALHTFISGATGTGKSTLMASMISEDIRNGHGVCVVDPHTGLFEAVLDQIPVERLKDVIVLDPADTSAAVGLNLLETKSEEDRHVVVNDFAALVLRLMRDQWGEASNFAGPIFLQHLMMNTRLATSDPDTPATIPELLAIFSDTQKAIERWLPLRDADPTLQDWVENVLPNYDYRKVGDSGASTGSYITSKIQPLLSDPRLMALFGQRYSSFDFLDDVIGQGKILLINLAKGSLGELASRMLGMVVMSKIYSAGMRRQFSTTRRSVFHFYVDEFESIASESAALMLSEARKWGITLTMAVQHWGQLDSHLQSAISGNVGTIISFRGGADAERIVSLLGSGINADDIKNLPNYHAYVRTLVEGVPAPAFPIKTLRHAWGITCASPYEVRAASAARYARPVREVLTEIANGSNPKTRTARDGEAQDVPPSPWEFEPVRAAIENLIVAVRRHNVAEIMSLIAPQAILVHRGHRLGYRQILAGVSAYCARRSGRDISATFDELEVRRDLAYCGLSWKLTRDSGTTGNAPDLIYRDMQLWQRQGDKEWRLLRGAAWPFHRPVEESDPVSV
jgi:ketosteroid isomerase-like protein